MLGLAEASREQRGRAGQHLLRLAEAATRAPSGDNTQPWRFELDPDASRIKISVDEARDPSPMNAGQRMSRIAVGAAAENILRTASFNGWRARIENPQDGQAVLLQVAATVSGEPVKVEEAIARRVTNRRLYTGAPVSESSFARLANETCELKGVRTLWIGERPRIRQLASLIGRADGIMFAESSMRRAFLANVRFGAAAGEEVAEGLSPASLELNAGQRAAFRAIAPIPDWLMRAVRIGSVFAKHSRRLVESASGVCLGVASNDEPATDIVVGMAMQRAWLALTECGLATQPMMSIPVLDNAVRSGSPALERALGAGKIAALMAQIRAAVPEMGAERPAFLLRFGFAAPPTGRTGRLPLKSVASLPNPREGRRVADG